MEDLMEDKQDIQSVEPSRLEDVQLPMDPPLDFAGNEIEIIEELEERTTIAEVSVGRHRVRFYHLLESGDILAEEDFNEKEPSSLVLQASCRTITETFLLLTDEQTPIPEAFRREAELFDSIWHRLEARRTTAEYVEAAPSVTFRNWDTLPQPTSSSAAFCSADKYAWFDWKDGPQPGLAPKIYYSSEVIGSKARKVDSFIRVCNSGSTPGHIRARHRVYYKFGKKYIKQADKVAAPNSPSTISLGLARHLRRVIYGDNWGSHPSSNAMYFRQGRFWL
jgi:hypothetical protein